MNYFTLQQKVEKPLSITFLPGDSYPFQVKSSQFTSLDEVKVGFFRPQSKEACSDVLHSPCFLFSDKMKLVLDEYFHMEDQKKKYAQILEAKAQGIEDFSLPEEEITPEPWKCIQVVPENGEGELFPRYWLYNMEKISCYHESTQFLPNKTLQHLVLDQKKIPPLACFQVGDILETRVILNLDLAEAVMRACPFGVTVEKVEVK